MNKAVVFALCLAAALLGTGGASAQTAGTQSPQSFNKQITRTLSAQYLLSLPKDYGLDPAKRWPLILFLHGSGESGADLEKVKVHGPPKLVAQGKEFPFIIVSPQAPSPREGWNSEVLIGLLDEVAQKYAVDADRVYLTGLSMGGFGTWNLATAYPDRFAAIAPICGGGEPRRAARRLKNVPVWVFHGAKDPTVPVKESQDMVDALKAAGAEVKFTVYPEAGHDSWTETYNNPELYEWFLQHHRQGAVK
jgi:predicted peptidase